MKLILLLALILSSTCFANSADYTCQVRGYRVDFFLIRTSSSTISVVNTDYYHLIAQGFVYHIEDKGDKTIFHYQGSPTGQLDLTFKKQDTLDLPAKLNAFIDTMADGFILRERLNCSKLN